MERAILVSFSSAATWAANAWASSQKSIGEVEKNSALAQKKAEKRFELLQKDINASEYRLTSEIHSLRKDQAEMRKDQAEMRKDQEEMRKDQEEMRKDVAEIRNMIKRDQEEMRKDVAEIRNMIKRRWWR